MTATSPTPRWSFVVPSMLGDTHLSFEIRDEALHFETDDPLSGGRDVIRWDTIREGGTAAKPGLSGRGALDMANWVPESLEWLTLSRTAGAGEPFMRALPVGAQRDTLVAELRGRLQGRWIGEGIPFEEARQRLALKSHEWSNTKVAGLVFAGFAVLALLLVALALLAHPLIAVPLGLLLGASVLYRGRQGLRDHMAMGKQTTTKIGAAALGGVRLQGRAVSQNLSPAAVSGRSCVWWDVWVGLWYETQDSPGHWMPVASRHGGEVGVLEIEDDTGRVPVWLHDAKLILDAQTWESDKDSLPAAGMALLNELGFAWNDGSRRIMVIEKCVAQGSPMYVVGTLDERRNLPEPGQLRGLQRLQESVRTGTWRRELVTALPRPTRMVAMVVIGYLDSVLNVGAGKRRKPRVEDAMPPALPPNARVVWHGSGGRPLVVSNLPDDSALEAWRKRSLKLCAGGAAVLLFTVYQLVEFVVG